MVKPFGYCSTGDHGMCPVVINIERTDKQQGTYRKHFECACPCHDTTKESD